jgi:hypothetical protein
VPGNNSLKLTIQAMNGLEQKTVIDMDFINFVKRTFKTNCVKCYPSLIHNFIVQNFKYSNDKFDEVIQAPYILLKTKTGDCDDFSLFAKCCLRILGLNPKYIVFARVPGKFTHVAVDCNGMLIDGTNALYNDWQTIFKKYKYYLFP